MSQVKASIVGASGYAGGELLRLLLAHPQVSVQQVTSQRFADNFVHFTHPNLRGQTRLTFSSLDDLEPCDLLFLALPHGKAMGELDRWKSLAPKIIDLSADFRLNDPETFERWYAKPHDRPDHLKEFIYGLPEINRQSLEGANYASGVGCNATATNLALLALADRGDQPPIVDWSRGIIVEVKVGSSEGGNSSGDASHHPVRAGVVRSFAATRHRHTAEILQTLAAFGVETEVHLSATAIEMVRGVLATAHVFALEGIEERDLSRAYRGRYKNEPFVRVVKERRGLYRYPEPKILAGSNFAEVGFEFDPTSRRIVSLSAIDNLMKGASGSAVQSMNLMHGWPETLGLEFPGLHPI